MVVTSDAKMSKDVDFRYGGPSYDYAVDGAYARFCCIFSLMF